MASLASDLGVASRTRSSKSSPAGQGAMAHKKGAQAPETEGLYHPPGHASADGHQEMPVPDQLRAPKAEPQLGSLPALTSSGGGLASGLAILSPSQRGELELARARAQRAAAGRSKAGGGGGRRTRGGDASAPNSEDEDENSDGELELSKLSPEEQERLLTARLANGGTSDKDARRLKRLLRNRVSAQQARERKKQYVSALEDQIREQQTHIDLLEKRVEAVESQNEALRNIIRTMRGFTETPPAGAAGAAAGLAAGLAAGGGAATNAVGGAAAGGRTAQGHGQAPAPGRGPLRAAAGGACTGQQPAPHLPPPQQQPPAHPPLQLAAAQVVPEQQQQDGDQRQRQPPPTRHSRAQLLPDQGQGLGQSQAPPLLPHRQGGDSGCMLPLPHLHQQSQVALQAQHLQPGLPLPLPPHQQQQQLPQLQHHPHLSHALAHPQHYLAEQPLLSMQPGLMPRALPSSAAAAAAGEELDLDLDLEDVGVVPPAMEVPDCVSDFR